MSEQLAHSHIRLHCWRTPERLGRNPPAIEPNPANHEERECLKEEKNTAKTFLHEDQWKAVATHGKCSVVATKEAETRRKGSVLPGRRARPNQLLQAHLRKAKERHWMTNERQ